MNNSGIDGDGIVTTVLVEELSREKMEGEADEMGVEYGCESVLGLDKHVGGPSVHFMTPAEVTRHGNTLGSMMIRPLADCTVDRTMYADSISGSISSWRLEPLRTIACFKEAMVWERWSIL